MSESPIISERERVFFRQIKHHGDNFSYIVGDESTGEAVVVDPSSNADAIVALLRKRIMRVRYVINTHHHTDHTVGNEDIRLRYGSKLVAHRLSRVDKDIAVVDGDVIKVGEITIKVIHTPGHTPDGICLLVNNKLLTGDTLFVGECGRADLPEGSAVDMYHSLFDKLLRLDDETEVYPGHDYGARRCSTIGRERRTNYTLKNRTVDEFIKFMKEP